MTAKKMDITAKKVDWIPMEPRDPLEATVFGSTSRTYIAGYTPPPRWEPEEGQFNDLTLITKKAGRVTQELFLDYIMLKGVENMTIDVHPGEPIRLHLDMIIGKVTVNTDDGPTE